jgi:hypothetical protein
MNYLPTSPFMSAFDPLRTFAGDLMLWSEEWADAYESADLRRFAMGDGG